jgi:hypothetical protein
MAKRKGDGTFLTEKAVIGKAEARLKGMRAIEPNGKLDLGGGVSIASLTAAQSALQDLIDRAENALTEQVAIKVQMKNQRAVVRDLNERALSGVKTRFGANSAQYEQVGGTRKSERKRPVRAPHPKTPIARPAEAPAAMATDAVAASEGTAPVRRSPANGHAAGIP